MYYSNKINEPASYVVPAVRCVNVNPRQICAGSIGDNVVGNPIQNWINDSEENLSC